MTKALTKISDIIEEISMGPFGSDIKVDSFVETGIPVLNGANLPKFKLLEEEFRYVTREKANTFRKAIAKRGDIVITHRGTLGQISYIPENSKFDEYVISQSQFRVALNRKLVDPVYFVYFFHTTEGQKRLLANKCHVGVPALAQATTNFKLVEIPLPDLTTQQKIASVLSALDSKIELNNRINAELEAMAKTMYDYWFVQSDFPDKNGKPYKTSGGKMVWNEELKREVPEGWEVKLLGTEIEIQRGISYTSKEINGDGIPMISLNSFNLNGTYKPEGIKSYSGKFTEKNIIKPGDLLIAATDVTRNADIIGRAILVPDYYKEELVFSMDIAKLYPKTFLPSFLMMLFNSNHYHNYIKWYASGTIVLHLNLDGIKRYNMELLPKELLEKYDSLYQPIANRIFKTALEKSKKLSELRLAIAHTDEWAGEGELKNAHKKMGNYNIKKCIFTDLEVSQFIDHNDAIEYQLTINEIPYFISLSPDAMEWGSKNEFFKKNKNIFFSLLYNGGWFEDESILITIEELKKLLGRRAIPQLPDEKIEGLFLRLFGEQKEDGEWIELDSNYYFNILWKRLYFKSINELNYYLEVLDARGLIDAKFDSNKDNLNYLDKYRITYQGLNHYLKLKDEGENSNKCFVAMSFRSETTEIRQAIKAALDETKFEAILIDEKNIESDKTINDEIIANLKRCKFCIADFTFHSNGVYFESGFALGQGKKVIYTCKEDEFKNAHFDIRPLQHIIYDTPEKLKTELINKINAWIY